MIQKCSISYERHYKKVVDSNEIFDIMTDDVKNVVTDFATMNEKTIGFAKNSEIDKAD